MLNYKICNNQDNISENPIKGDAVLIEPPLGGYMNTMYAQAMAKNQLFYYQHGTMLLSHFCPTVTKFYYKNLSGYCGLSFQDNLILLGGALILWL